MGVAVITSTSGCTPFCSSSKRCITPKRCCSSTIAKPELLKLDVFLQQRVRADRDVRIARRNQFLELPFFAAVNEPVSCTTTYPSCARAV